MFYVGCSRVCSDCSLFRTCINFRKASCEPHEATRESAKRATYCYTCDVTLCNLTSDGILSKFLHRCCRMQSHDLFFGLFSQWCSWNPKTKPREVCNDCYWRIDFFLRGVRDSCWPHDHCANFYWSLGRVLSCYCSRDSPNTLHPSQAARGTAKTAERRRRTDRAADSKHVNAPVTQLRVFLVSLCSGSTRRSHLLLGFVSRCCFLRDCAVSPLRCSSQLRVGAKEQRGACFNLPLGTERCLSVNMNTGSWWGKKELLAPQIRSNPQHTGNH